MQDKFENVIQFTQLFKNENNLKNFDFEENVFGACDVLNFKKPEKNYLFKNALVCDIEQETLVEADIWVRGKKIAKIGKNLQQDEKILKDVKTLEIIDLNFAIVLPCFVNRYFEKKDYLNVAEWILNEYAQKHVTTYLYLQSFFNGVFTSSIDTFVLKNVEELEEQELSRISDKIAKEKSEIYLKVGQSLDELGAIDKKFGKALPYVLEDFGFLDRNFTIVGGNCFEKDDLQVFLNYGNRYIVCPSEDGQMGRRPVNLLRLKNMGFDVSFGTGRTFEIDFFALMRQVLMTQWGMFEDKSVLTEKDVLLMATGNRTCICENDEAYFIAVENNSFQFDNILKCIVWGTSQQDVKLMISRGELVQQNGILKFEEKKFGNISRDNFREFLKSYLRRRK